MERLTEKFGSGYCLKYCFEENPCSETSGICLCDECSFPGKAYQKLGEYEDLGEQNRLIKLPCAVGDTVYAIKTVKRKDIIRKEIWDYIVTSFHIERDCDWNVSFEHIEPNGRIFPTQGEFKDFDKTVFLTIEEAEAALKELERGKEK